MSKFYNYEVTLKNGLIMEGTVCNVKDELDMYEYLDREFPDWETINYDSTLKRAYKESTVQKLLNTKGTNVSYMLEDKNGDVYEWCGCFELVEGDICFVLNHNSSELYFTGEQVDIMEII